MQRMVTLWGRQLEQKDNELARLLAEGWKVVRDTPFSEHVVLAYGGRDNVGTQRGDNFLRGDYGVVFIVEKETEEE